MCRKGPEGASHKMYLPPFSLPTPRGRSCPDRNVKTILRRLKGTRRARVQYPWTTVDDRYFAAVRGEAREQLAVGVSSPRPRRALPFRGNHRSQQARDPNSWPNACLVLGLMTAYRLFRDRQDLDAITRFFDAVIDSRGAFRRPLHQVDQCMIGYTLIEAFEYTGQPRYRQAADALARFLLDVHQKTESGTLPYTARLPSFVLVDTLAMVCPFLAGYGSRFAAPEATSLAVAQLDEFLGSGLNAKLGLPFHGFEVGGAEDLGIVGWARGTGWLAIALADTLASLTLASLQSEHEARPRLVAAMRALADAVKKFQREDGSWLWAITIPEGAVDTSGTGMIGYALERAAALGIVGTEWESVSHKALTAIARLTRTNGLVDKANAECLGVGLHPAKSGPAPWAQGPAVALAALVLDRNQRRLAG